MTRVVVASLFACALGSLCVLSACSNEVTPTTGELDEGNATAIGILSTSAQGPPGAYFYVAEFALINRTDLTCAVLQSEQGADVEYSNFRAVGASVSSPDPIVAGTYTVGATSLDGSAQAFQEHTDSKCATDVDNGASGVVVFTRVDATAIEGTFDVIFHSGSHLKGAFNAPTCALDLSETSTGQVPLCE